MTRVLFASYPDWPAIAAGYHPDEPVVVVSANRVVAATEAARSEGVVPGLRRREAQARCPEAEVVPADAGRDARAWEPAVAAVEELAPAVEIPAPGEVLLATRGPSRYFGGDEALAALVANAIDSAVGVEGCVVGVGDGRFAAGLAARAAGARGGVTGARGGMTGAGRVLVLTPGASRRWLAPQPVGSLGAAYEELAGLLSRLGIRTLGDLAALPAPSVLARFGTAGATAHRLARGLDPSPVAAREPPEDMSVCAEFDPPEERVEAAAFVAKALADRLHSRLEADGLACTMVSIEAQTEHGESLVRRWRHEGALTASALADRARWQLEGWFAGSNGDGGGASGRGERPTAGLLLLRLTPEEVHQDKGRQLGFWGGSAESDERAARAFARVQGLLGPDGVSTAVIAGGRGFADQVRLVPWGDARQQPGAPSGQAPWPGRVGAPAPAVVFDTGVEAEVYDAEGQPVGVDGRGLLGSPPSTVSFAGGPPSAVKGWAGPWPLEERWWDGGGRRRARIQVLLDDGEAHLLSREGGRWWLEASYS